jgi:hypothetical protein
LLRCLIRARLQPNTLPNNRLSGEPLSLTAIPWRFEVNASASMPWTPLNQHSSARTAGAKTTGAALWQARALAEFLEASSPTHCQFVTRDRYGRFVGNCFRSDHKSIAAYLVRSGMAMDWHSIAKANMLRSRPGQSRRSAGSAGVSSHPPWEWRAEQRRKVEITDSLPASSCKIKGNIPRKGARIYHLPGQRDYEKTGIDERKGERWFCSEADARAAEQTASRR